MPEHPRRWFIEEPDGNACTGVRVFIEPDHTLCLHSRPRHASPGQQLVGHLLGDLSVPGHRYTGGAFSDPVRLTASQVADLLEMRHEARKLLVIRPERKNIRCRRVNVHHLVELEYAWTAAGAHNLSEFPVRDSACKQGRSRHAAAQAQRAAVAQAVPEQRGSGATGRHSKRRRPVLLRKLRPALSWDSALEARDLAGIPMHHQPICHFLDAGDGLHGAEQAIDFMLERGSVKHDSAVLQSDIDRMRMAHHAAHSRPDPLNERRSLGWMIRAKRCLDTACGAVRAIRYIPARLVEEGCEIVPGAYGLVASEGPPPFTPVRIGEVHKQGACSKAA